MQWQIPYDSFWRMTLQEWFWIFDVRRTDADKVSLLADRELWEMIGETAPYG